MRSKLSPDIQGQKAFAQLPQGLSADKDTQDQFRRFIQASATKRDLKKVADDVTNDIATAVSNVTTALSTKSAVVSLQTTTVNSHPASGTLDFFVVSDYDPEGWWNPTENSDRIIVMEEGVYLFNAMISVAGESTVGGSFPLIWYILFTATLYDAAGVEIDDWQQGCHGTSLAAYDNTYQSVTFSYVLPARCGVGYYVQIYYSTLSANDASLSMAINSRVSLTKVG